MRETIDTTALGRSTIGFERIFDLLQAGRDLASGETYPPYNIEKVGEDRYRIELAVAGFTLDDLTVSVESNRLTVSGKKPESESGVLLYQGISGRPFSRQFSLADYVVVRGAKLVNGLLTIDLERELPEAMKPRQIPIGTDAKLTRTTDRKAA